MILQMKKASFVGAKDELKGLIETLKSTGMFEMSFFKKTKTELDSRDNEMRDHYNSVHARVKSALTFAARSFDEYKTACKTYMKSNPNSGYVNKKLKKDKAVWNSISNLTYDELKNVRDSEGLAMELVADLEKQSIKLNDIKNQITRNTELVKDLKPYLNLPMDFDSLRDTKNAFILVGIIPSNQLKKFKGDIDTSKFSVAEYPSSPNKICAIITGHHDDYPIANAIFGYQFERAKFAFNQTPSEKVQTLSEVNVALDIEKLSTLQKSLLSSKQIELLKHYYDYIANELDTFELQASTLQTQKYYVLNGWIIARQEQMITELVTERHPSVLTKIETPTEQDEPPVYIKSNKLVAPFESVTNMYGAPSRGDLDPNPYVAIFYFIFFGMMIGDVGYGLLLSGLCLFVLLKKKPQGGMKSLISLFALGGIAAIIWGALYGSLFGSPPQDASFDSFLGFQIINPIGGEDATFGAIHFFILALGMGVIQIMFGIGLNFYNKLKHKQFLDAFLNPFARLVMFLGIIFVIGGFMVAPLAALLLPGAIIAGVGLVTMMVGNAYTKKGILGKIVGAISGVYSLVGYFSDVLSYARLFAIALVGSVIGLVANTMGAMFFGIPVIGYPLGIIIAILFHTINLGLGLLGAYVHGARLQFIEFFSKFYRGEGKLFTPVGGNLKYTRIVSKIS
jgi:V/A-type H+-transporting ATPase subunit I